MTEPHGPAEVPPTIGTAVRSFAKFVGGFFVGLIGACVVSIAFQIWTSGSLTSWGAPPRPAQVVRLRRTVAISVEIALFIGLVIAWFARIRRGRGAFTSGLVVGAAIAFLLCAACFGLVR